LSRSATNCRERIDPDDRERRESELDELEHRRAERSMRA
jgi:hypothetical protein